MRGIKIAGLEVLLDWREKGAPLTDVLRAMDEWASAGGRRVVVAIDGAQHLRLAGRTSYDGLLAWAIDNLSSLTFASTGSQVGILQDFLGVEDPRSPLYGRHIKLVHLARLERGQSPDFLRRGFREAGVKQPPELEEVVEALDGLIGWPTLYGHAYISGKNPNSSTS